MKNKSIKLLLFIFIFTPLVGCGGPKEVHERGWIGGEYERVNTHTLWFNQQRVTLPNNMTQAVYLSHSFSDTPAELSGLREGDIILRADEEIVDDVEGFRSQLESLEPGSKLRLKVLRFGELKDIDVVVGTEKYTRGGKIWFGFGISSQLSLWPTSFNVFNIVKFQSHDDRIHLQDAVHRLIEFENKNCGKKHKMIADEGLEFNLLVFGVKQQSTIVSQLIYKRQ